MVEIQWWQAALLSVAGAAAGGLISLVTAFFTQCWAASNTIKAEERQAQRRAEEEQSQAQRRAEEEQRQVVRRVRRDRIQPVLDYLEMWKRYFVGRAARTAFEEEYKKSDPQEEAAMTSADWQEIRSLVEEDVPTAIQLTKAYGIAVTSSISVPALQAALGKMHSGVRTDAAADIGRQVGTALQSAEELIEQYLAGVKVGD